MLLIAMLSLISSAPGQASNRFVEVSPTAFAQLKDGLELATATRDREARLKTFAEAALASRGHSGNTDYLQGCDVSDRDADYLVANLQLVAASADWPSYDMAWRSARLPEDDTLPAQASLVATIIQAAQADQAVRSLLFQPIQDGAVGEAIAALRMVSMCEQDLAHGALLDSEPVRNLFANTDDGTILRGLYVMALHADHLPRLQEDYAQIYMSRRSANGWPAEPGLRLIDRSRTNLGLPQTYATGVICEAGKPVLAGTANLAEANVQRAAFGLPPQDLDTLTRDRFCG